MPGSGEVGCLAAGGAIPTGYYKDAAKTASTFREVNGAMYSFPGDMARIEADGSITLLGRGSGVINTGGEKVFCEEVEEAAKRVPGVEDCLVVGVNDDRFGQAVTAVVSLEPGVEVLEHAAGRGGRQRRRCAHGALSSVAPCAAPTRTKF